MKNKKSDLSLAEIGKRHTELSALPNDLQLDPKMAAEALQVMGIKIARQTLAKIRCVSSNGPSYQKVGNGRVVYKLGDLREFAGITNR